MVLIRPVLLSTVAEPLPALIEKVILPPRPNVAVVVAIAFKLPPKTMVLSDVIVNVGVAIPIVIH